ncbi:hypothetical protein HDU93_008226 [Gonapodya sp. JEL0774]|nr:hypothetical protein HDU93_008226 [Gonapodya sp. JEL0774]
MRENDLDAFLDAVFLDFDQVELVATEDIDFSITPWSVIWANNGGANANGWIQGGGVTYGFNINSGVITAGSVGYVGGTSMAPTGQKLRVINTGTTGGDSFGTAALSGVMGNGGSNADAIAVFNVPISQVTSTTTPVDAIFYGTAVGTAFVSVGGYQLPINDKYSGGTLQLTSGLSPGDVVFNAFNGQGNDFIELLVVKDGADLRGLRISDNEIVGGVLNTGESVIVFTDSPWFQSIPKGTLIGIWVQFFVPGVVADVTVNPADGDWTMMLETGDGSAVTSSGLLLSSDGLGGTPNSGLSSSADALYLYTTGANCLSTGTDNVYIDFIRYGTDTTAAPSGIADLLLPSPNAYFTKCPSSPTEAVALRTSGNWVMGTVASTLGQPNPTQDLSCLGNLASPPLLSNSTTPPVFPSPLPDSCTNATDLVSLFASTPQIEPSDLTFNPDTNKVLMIDDEGRIGIMNSDGSNAQVFTIDAGADLEGVTVVPGRPDFAYASVETVGSQDTIVHEWSLLTKTIIRSFTLPGCIGTESIAFVPSSNSPTNGFWFCAPQFEFTNGSLIYRYTIDLTSGIVTPLGTVKPVLSRDVSTITFWGGQYITFGHDMLYEAVTLDTLDPAVAAVYLSSDAGNTDGSKVPVAFRHGYFVKGIEGITFTQDYVYLARDDAVVKALYKFTRTQFDSCFLLTVTASS